MMECFLPVKETMDGDDDDVVIFMIVFQRAQDTFVDTAPECLHCVLIGIQNVFGVDIQPVALGTFEHELPNMMHLHAFAQLL